MDTANYPMPTVLYSPVASLIRIDLSHRPNMATCRRDFRCHNVDRYRWMPYVMKSEKKREVLSRWRYKRWRN